MAIEVVVIVDPPTRAVGPLEEEEDNAKDVTCTGHKVSKEKNIKDTMTCSIILCLFVCLFPYIFRMDACTF
jgi:hypothetical protein